ncbi:SRPBCC domain-containing protein [Microbispora sp. NPDC049125]|uniref:SRPBCC family protein n=1 Tax=Microbispora sp. NPDC049125 TaxID=3154929 RepID=UPI00346644A6
MHEFEVREEIQLDATPEQVWEAIATGPGVDSWFMGRNEIEPGVGGATKMTMAGFTAQGTVTAWEPGVRFAYQGDKNPDGTFMAFEYLIEGREGGTTTLRLVHNGFLGDNWEAEYEALKTGDFMYLCKLAAYLKYFPGRTATSVSFVPGSGAADQARMWAKIGEALSLTGPAVEGAPVRIAVEGLPPADGVVAFAAPTYVGVATSDELYMFAHAQNMALVECHGFAGDADPEAIEGALRSWLDRSFA